MPNTTLQRRKEFLAVIPPFSGGIMLLIAKDGETWYVTGADLIEGRIYDVPTRGMIAYKPDWKALGLSSARKAFETAPRRIVAEIWP